MRGLAVGADRLFSQAARYKRPNGYRLCASQIEATKSMLAVAPGEMGEADFAAWIRGNSKKTKKK